MTRHYVYCDSEGFAQFETHLPPAMVPAPVDGMTVVERAEPIGTAPEDGARFHVESGEWRDMRTLEGTRVKKATLVNTERARRSVVPIEYSGRRLDADQRAQKNISDKLSEIKAREDMGQEMPPELMLWRDADNIDQTFENMGQMKAWLQGLVVAIAQRGTEAYVWAWQMKAAIASASTKEELDAIAW